MIFLARQSDSNSVKVYRYVALQCLELQYRLKYRCFAQPFIAANVWSSGYLLLPVYFFPSFFLFRHILFFTFSSDKLSVQFPVSVIEVPKRLTPYWQPPFPPHWTPFWTNSLSRNLEIFWYTSIRISIAVSFIRGAENLILLHHSLHRFLVRTVKR
jgi:hypothetical protein